MNTFKKIMTAALAALSFLAVSCDRTDTEPQEIYLDVNANNISGKWAASCRNALKLGYELLIIAFYVIEIIHTIPEKNCFIRRKCLIKTF